jgi:predicted phage terminase large subunit-like protein
MKFSAEALQALQQIKLGQMDLHVIERLPRSVLNELSQLLTPKMTKYIPHVPTAKQSAFMLLDNKEAFYGGAAGGGKSDCLLMAGLQNVDVKGYAGIIFRKNYSDLVKPGALIDRSKEWLFRFPDVRWVDKEKKFEFLGKYGPHTEVISILQFGYLETDNDRFNYQGGEYQFVGFDELTHMSLICYQYLFSRLRRLNGMDVPLRVRGASNPPDDDQGQWVYDRFVNDQTKKPGTIFVSAGLDDNPFLDKKSYIESLNELDPVTRARLRDGLWTVIRKGNMFKRDWFDTVEKAPPFRRKIRFWDMAATDVEKAKKKNKRSEPDWTVGALVSEHRGIYYIEDLCRFRKSPNDTQEIQRATATADGKKVKIVMEQEPGSSGVIAIDLYMKDIFNSFYFKGIRSTGSKVDRANPFSAKAEKGCVKFVKGCRNMEEFFNEAESFPGGSHDDMIDAISGAISELMLTATKYGQMPTVVGETTSYWDEASYY